MEEKEETVEPKLYTEKELTRLRNLKMFKDNTDEEIIEYLNGRKAKEPEKPESEYSAEEQYQRKFQNKLRQFQREYAVDMNESNDAEALRSLVRMAIQNEDMNNKIRIAMAQAGYEPKDLKSLFDAQRAITTSMAELQDRLGISRRQRKEKQQDDVTKYLADLRKKAKEFWDRKTLPVMCPKCEIELARFWINFPKISHEISFTTTCWKCQEKVVFNK